MLYAMFLFFDYEYTLYSCTHMHIFSVYELPIAIKVSPLRPQAVVTSLTDYILKPAHILYTFGQHPPQMPQ